MIQTVSEGRTTIGKALEERSFDIVHADALRLFSPLVNELGVAADSVLAEARIDPEVLRQPASALEYLAFVNLLALAAERTGCSDFGMRLAERQRGGKVIGPVGVVMKNSETVGQALGYCAKNTHAYSRATKVRFRPNRGEHILLVAVEFLLDRVADLRQAAEHAIALASYNITDISNGMARSRQIRFRHDPVSQLKVYRDRFGCETLFGQDTDGFVLTEDDLLCEVVESDEQVYEMATNYIDQRFPSEAAPIEARVRSLVLDNLSSDDCTSEWIAGQLCMHARTLQRRLRAVGTSFEGIKDEVRREVALRYLRQDDIPLVHVAQKLGYAETSVLSRSCHRWFETSPMALRKQSMAEMAATGKYRDHAPVAGSR